MWLRRRPRLRQQRRAPEPARPPLLTPDAADAEAEATEAWREVGAADAAVGGPPRRHLNEYDAFSFQQPINPINPVGGGDARLCAAAVAVYDSLSERLEAAGAIRRTHRQ